jgi:dipeptidyl aminopeptidase/acylaminoacyl peptidase
VAVGSEREPACEIVLGPQASRQAAIGAEEINREIAELGGKPAPVAEQSRRDDGLCVYVGSAEQPHVAGLASELGVKVTTADPGPQGYVVAFCNPRGSRGYGEEHARAIWNRWGSVDYADLMAWADFVAEKPTVDSERMGVTGGSYGGYMTNWIIGHTDRFQAAVTQRSVSNLISMYGSSDFNWSFQQEFGDQPPWEALESYWEQSPISHIGNAATPTLVIHSENDFRCPIEQGEQVFVALKKLGVDTEMIRFPDEPHGLSRGGRTDRRVERLEHILRWFERHLKEDET